MPWQNRYSHIRFSYILWRYGLLFTIFERVIIHQDYICCPQSPHLNQVSPLQIDIGLDNTGASLMPPSPTKCKFIFFRLVCQQLFHFFHLWAGSNSLYTLSIPNEPATCCATLSASPVSTCFFTPAFSALQ